MKLRGIIGGLSLLLEAQDSFQTVQAQLTPKPALLKDIVAIEFEGELAGDLLWEILAMLRMSRDTLPVVRMVAKRSTEQTKQHEQRESVSAADVNTRSDTSSVVTVVHSGVHSVHSAQSTSVPVTITEHHQAYSPQPAAASQQEVFPTHLVRHSLRSGTRLEHAGHVVVVGDVNSGVEIVAGGDIVVTGALRGLAHAGFPHKTDAIVCASPIAAPQIRIAEAVARAPEGSTMLSSMRRQGQETEIARLVDGQIIIEGTH